METKINTYLFNEFQSNTKLLIAILVFSIPFFIFGMIYDNSPILRAIYIALGVTIVVLSHVFLRKEKKTKKEQKAFVNELEKIENSPNEISVIKTHGIKGFPNF